LEKISPLIYAFFGGSGYGGGEHFLEFFAEYEKATPSTNVTSFTQGCREKCFFKLASDLQEVVEKKALDEGEVPVRVGASHRLLGRPHIDGPNTEVVKRYIYRYYMDLECYRQGFGSASISCGSGSRV